MQPPPPCEDQEMAVADENNNRELAALEMVSVEEKNEKPGNELSLSLSTLPDDDDDDSASKLPIVDYNPPIEATRLGKRKRKTIIKELHDDASKSKQAVLYSRGRSLSHKQNEAAVPTPIQMKSPILIRAEEVLSSLGQEYPSFLKLLVQSHVDSCYWMGLPASFCKQHLPREDISVTLENNLSSNTFQKRRDLVQVGGSLLLHTSRLKETF